MQQWHQRIAGVLSTLSLGVVMTACGGAQKAAEPAPTPPPPAQVAAPPPAPAPPQDSVAFYLGSYTATSPDGKQQFGKSTYVVKRSVLPASRTIVEEVKRDNFASVTTLRQRGDTPVFDVSDATGAFTGTVTFSGNPYGPSSWTYLITITKTGQIISGTGALTNAGIQTNKLISEANGKESARALEQLAPSTEAANAGAAAAMRPPR
jgi:hypothetical protein